MALAEIIHSTHLKGMDVPGLDIPAAWTRFARKDQPAPAGIMRWHEDVILKVPTAPRDRTLTGEPRPVAGDLRIMQGYLCDVMGVMKSKIDLTHS